MTIGWVQDINFIEMPNGGAQSNDLGMYRYLEKERGLEQDILTPNNVNERLSKKYELLIISNCTRFSHELLLKLTKDTPYIMFCHDYYFCNFRLHFPGRESCKRCPKVDFWNGFHKNAKKNIFLSPFHFEMHELIFGKENLGKKVYIPSILDLKFWIPMDIQRKKGTIISVNGLQPFKGRYNLNSYIEQHPELSFTIVGDGVQLKHKNCKYLGYQTPEQLRELYSTHEHLIHLPDNTDPFCRVVMEALLCGCKVIGNKNIGAFSYDWNFKDQKELRNYLRQAGPGFADEIYEVLKEIRRK